MTTTYWVFLVCLLVCFGHMHSLRDLSSATREQTHAPAVKAPSHNHWTAGEFPIYWILGASWTEWNFNSDDHYIYYCGQESLRRNGIALIVNKRVQNAVLGCKLKNNKMISVCFQGKPFNIKVVQLYAPTSNAEEAEVERFYEYLQDLLELTPPKDVLFIIGDWNAKVGSQEITWSNRQIWPWSAKWSRAKANRVLLRERTSHSKHTLQQHKRRLYTWTSPDGQYQNQIDCILCSWRWRSCVQSKKKKQTKTRSWLWLRSWTPYCQIKTEIEESRENH